MKKILKSAFAGSAKRFVGGAVVGFATAAVSAHAADAIDTTTIVAAIVAAGAAAAVVGAAYTSTVAGIKAFKLIRSAM
ncbi:major capsid protein [Pseudoduganella sp. R-34]|uniref:major capsid protein n=1 Tax=Pseudoduganella sp. R-34 TaxID=3404062 RepID=UPI003CF07307